MLNIRRNLFETNSSSVHSLTLCSNEEYERWKAGVLWYFIDDKKFYNEKERLNICKRKIIYGRCDIDRIENKITYNRFSDNFNFRTLNTFLDRFLEDISDEEAEEFAKKYSWSVPMTFYEYDKYADGFDQFKQEYITPSGDKVIAFGYVGWDG